MGAGGMATVYLVGGHTRSARSRRETSFVGVGRVFVEYTT